VRADANGFAIGNKGYICSGYNGICLNDLWQYDTLSNSWTQKANFPGTARCDAAAFSICDKGYFGTGDPLSTHLNDWWQYDTTLNTWTQKAQFPDSVRDETAYFAIGNKGYLGLGGEPVIYNTFYEYTPDSGVCN